MLCLCPIACAGELQSSTSRPKLTEILLAGVLVALVTLIVNQKAGNASDAKKTAAKGKKDD